ncbi:MAG TPA: hypothetical protein VNT92_03235 [Acidimicrobiia bacterium]|nr:hypothetical protein [Acidimicrobiia bacterium]
MRNSKHGLKALVLAMMAAVLGTTAFVASAQAQTHTEKLHALTLHAATLNPNQLSSPSTNSAGTFTIDLGSALLAELVARQVGEAELLVAARGLIMKCIELHLVPGSHINSSTDATATVEFLGCLPFSHSTLSALPGCGTKELGTIKAAFLILPILHGGQLFVLFEPVAGQSTFTITVKPNLGCVLPLNSPIGGAISARVASLEAVTQLLLFDEAIQLLIGDVLKYGALSNTAYIKGHVDVELAGPHEGLKLRVH